MNTTKAVYQCGQCDIDNDTPLCRGCNHFLTEDLLLVDEMLQNPPVPEHPFRYGTAFAHWGDTMASMSITKYTLDAIGQKSCGMIYTGPDARIVDMLRAQPWINDVKFIKSPAYDRAYQLACQCVTSVGEWLPLIDDGTLPPCGDVWPTHHHQCFGRTYKVSPLAGAKLPVHSKQTAKQIFVDAVSQFKSHKVIMVHPLSTWSYPQSGHWRHWQEAVEWLLKNTPHVYVLTGLVPAVQYEHKRLVDLVGKIPTNLEVLALSELCDGVVSTCNSLALWNVIQGKPGIVCGNGAIRNYVNYFRRFIDRPPNAYLDVHAPLEDFVQVAEQWSQDPQMYAANLFVEMGARRGVHRANLKKAAVKPTDIRPKIWYRVTRGVVSGKQRDFPAGSVVEANDLNGGPNPYVEQGLLEQLRQSFVRGRSTPADLAVTV